MNVYVKSMYIKGEIIVYFYYSNYNIYDVEGYCITSNYIQLGSMYPNVKRGDARKWINKT